MLCSHNFIVGQTLFLCPVLKKFQDLYSGSAVWQLLLSWSVHTRSVPLLSCISPLVSYTYQWRFLWWPPFKRSDGLFSSAVLYHLSLPPAETEGYLCWLCFLYFLIWDLDVVPGWSWQIVMVRRIPTFAGGSIEIVVGDISQHNLMLALWCPCVKLNLVPSAQIWVWIPL